MQKNRQYYDFLVKRIKDVLIDFNKKFRTELVFSEKKYEHAKDFIDGEITFNNEKLFNVVIRDQIKQKLERKTKDLVGSTLIITERNIKVVYSKFHHQEEIKEYEFARFETIIFKEIKESLIKTIEEKQKNVLEVLNNEIKKHNLNFPLNKESLIFNEDMLRFVFAPAESDRFFNHLLSTYENEVCRYTTQATIFATLTSGKLRMLSIAGMNDIGEIDYVDKYLYEDKYVPLSSSNYNNQFILSCAEETNFDDLTMYRLYGDDAKGVCLKYKLNSAIIDKHFYVKKVEYADKWGRNPKLEIIKAIINMVEKKTGHIIDFFGDSGWKYFFKPFEYKYEKEVRVLFNNNDTFKRQWLITNNTSILNPFIEIEHGIENMESPLLLKEICLGPKHFEKVLNKTQFEQLLSDRKPVFGDVEVTISKINNYR